VIARLSSGAADLGEKSWVQRRKDSERQLGRRVAPVYINLLNEPCNAIPLIPGSDVFRLSSWRTLIGILGRGYSQGSTAVSGGRLGMTYT
jgi:hypothetical protein